MRVDPRWPSGSTLQNNRLALAVLARGSIGWVIQRYRDSEEHRYLNVRTIKNYQRFLREIDPLGPSTPFASFSHGSVVDFIETYSKAHQRRQSAAVLKQLFKRALHHGVAMADKTACLHLKTSRLRDRIWTDEEVARWMKVDGTEDPHLTTMFLPLKFTARRPKDVFRMVWPQYSAIRRGEQKIGALLDIPARQRTAAKRTQLPRFEPHGAPHRRH